jgi:cytochrome c oxidase subunit 2
MADFLGLPVLASDNGAVIDQTIIIIHIMMVAAFLIWGGLFIWPLIRYRKKKNPTADYAGMKSRMPNLLEASLAIGELSLLFWLALPYWSREIVSQPAEGEDVYTVRVVAQQFMWNVHYPGPDGVFGRTDIELIDDQLNPLGLDPDDASGEDDLTTRSELYIPVDKTVQIHLSSFDVIHSFAMPEMRVKQDAIPGLSIPIHFTANMTTAEFRELEEDEERDFEIVCSQLCGLQHYSMKGRATVVEQAELDEWYAEKLEEKRAFASDDYF